MITERQRESIEVILSPVPIGSCTLGLLTYLIEIIVLFTWKKALWRLLCKPWWVTETNPCICLQVQKLPDGTTQTVVKNEYTDVNVNSGRRRYWRLFRLLHAWRASLPLQLPLPISKQSGSFVHTLTWSYIACAFLYTMSICKPHLADTSNEAPMKRLIIQISIKVQEWSFIFLLDSLIGALLSYAAN